jgi:hypothetical protein
MPSGQSDRALDNREKITRFQPEPSKMGGSNASNSGERRCSNKSASPVARFLEASGAPAS